jgi:hypothetical protein
VRIGPTAWPFTGFIHTDIHTDRQLDKYILDIFYKTSYLNEEVKCTEVSHSVSIPWMFFIVNFLFPVHRSEKFWRENADRLKKRFFFVADNAPEMIS